MIGTFVKFAGALLESVPHIAKFIDWCTSGSKDEKLKEQWRAVNDTASEELSRVIGMLSHIRRFADSTGLKLDQPLPQDLRFVEHPFVFLKWRALKARLEGLERELSDLSLNIIEMVLCHGLSESMRNEVGQVCIATLTRVLDGRSSMPLGQILDDIEKSILPLRDMTKKFI